MSRSFLEEIQKRKCNLRFQETIVTSTSGERYLEKKVNGELKSIKISDPCFGFVIDEKPDLHITEILPYLYLSSQDVVQDHNLLTVSSITHVLSIGVNLSNISLLSDIDYKTVDLHDLPEADLLNILEECFKFITDSRKKSQHNKILVHCNAGYSRSPSVIIAYLMKEYKFKLQEAIEYVKEKRNIKPNDGFLNQLKLYEKSLFQ